MDNLTSLLRANRRLGISRMMVIMPGRRGYESDTTPRTFIDLEMLANTEVLEDTSFALSSSRYFPGNIRSLGNLFPHHDLQVVYDAATISSPCVRPVPGNAT